MTRTSLNIAIIYESRTAYAALGYSPSECDRLEVGEAADEIASTLKRLGHEVVLVPDIQSLTRKLADGEHRSWDLAFNMTEGVHGVAREAQVPAMLEAFKVPFTFSDAATMALCLDKGRTKMVLEHYGVPTAPFAVIRFPTKAADLQIEEIQQMIQDSVHADALRKYPLFAKPLAEGSSMGIVASNKINQPADICHVVNSLRASSTSSPGILIETFLSGREFTVGILGTGEDAWILGADEIVWKGKRDDNNSSTEFTTALSKATDDWDGVADVIKGDRGDPEVELACEAALKAWIVLGCRDGGRVDMRLDPSSGKPVAHVLEINPLAGLREHWSQLPEIAKHNDVSYDELMNHIVESAIKRYRSVD